MLPRIHDARAWTAATIDDRTAWYVPLPEVCLSTFEQIRAELTHDLSSPAVVKAMQATRKACADALTPVRDALERGRGFAIIEAPRLAPPEATLLYWFVGAALGRPFAQNVQGTMLYDVRDTGANLEEGARFSVTSYESSFHTDNSFGDCVLDYVGLLCLQTAKSGGRSQIVSGYAVHNALAEQKDLLETLYQSFHVEHRGGAGRTVDVPIFQAAGDELLVRYLRYWIETGHTKIGTPLTPEQAKALDALDACLNRPDLRVEFDLKPGDMYFINNRWTLHNRTAFEDHAAPERRRHLVRLWLQKP